MWSLGDSSHGNPVYGQTPLMVPCLLNACVHGKDKPFVVRDSIVSCLLRQFVDLASQKWLLSCPDVCLGTLTPLQPIVTKNMCFSCSPPCGCHAAEDELF